MERSEINAVLASAGLRPQHKFGQNFMVDQKALAAIVDAGEIGPEDVVLEVGPGVGNLTRQLAQRAAAVLAVDIDRKLMPAAAQHHAELKNVTWLNADVLAGKHEINPSVVAALQELSKAHSRGSLKLVSNLPYNAASPLVAELLVLMWQHARCGEAKPLFFERLAFTVQWEVGDRMVASPNTSDFGPLTVIIQALADAKVVRKIPPGAFWPPPKVNSALVVVRPDTGKISAAPDMLGMQKLVTGLFSHRRQTLHNALRHHLGGRYTDGLKRALSDAGIDVTLRPEAIRVGQYLEMGRMVERPT